MKRLKQLLLILIIVMMTVCTVISVNADSNDRISTFISLASGKQTSNLDITKLNLSKRDLQFLGVYISNFFVPFGTEFGNEESESINKEDIKKALQTNLSFSDSMADSLTETLIGLSKGSLGDKQLSLYVSKEYQKDLVPVDKMPLNGYTAYTCMLGGLQELSKNYTKGVPLDINRGLYKYGYFAYEYNGGDPIPVFDFSTDGEIMTPSMVAFLKCLEAVDMEKGYGFNFFDFTEEEMGKTASDYKDKVEKLSDELISQMSLYGTKVHVDCFGNIIMMGKNHQYVAVPGCMNPYTWSTVDKNGNETGKGLGGTVYNTVNIPSMIMLENEDKSKRLFSEYSLKSDSKLGSGVVNTSLFDTKLYNVSQDSKNGDYNLRLVRGSDKYKVSNDIMFDGDILGSSYRDLFKKAEDGYVATINDKEVKNYYPVKVSGNKTDSIIVSGSPMKDGSVFRNKNVDFIDSFIFVDDLGAFHFDSSDEDIGDYKSLVAYHYLSDNKVDKLRESMKASSKSHGFSNTYKDIESGKMVIPTNIPKEASIGIYLTYAFAGLYDEGSKQDTIGELGFRLNVESLPEVPDEPLMLSAEATGNYKMESITDWVYYMLHPTEGIEYFKTWAKNKINGFMLGWHDDMVGTSGTGSINGTTKYRGFSGYVTTPELTDMPWTDSLLNVYNSSIPFIIVIMIIIMLGAYVVGILSLQKAIIGLGIFSICAALPPITINGLVGTSNRFSSKLYGEKFTYWALVQHESYSTLIDEKSKGGSYENYLKTLYETNSKAKGNQGSESIMLKWQAPKKMSSLMFTGNDREGTGGLLASNMIGGLINSTYSGESYLDNNESVYLYRSYIDIANFSRYIHRGLAGSTAKQPVNLNITDNSMKNWDTSLKEAMQDYSANYELDRNNGYANKNGNGSVSGTSKDIIRVRLPLASSIVSDAYGQGDKIKDLQIGEYVGIPQDAFNFSIPMFNVGSINNDKGKKLSFTEELKNEETGFNPTRFNGGVYTNEDYSALAAYGLMSENPFYYFSWYLYESGLSTDTNSHIGYKNLLLGQDNAGFFYNTKGNGELKDFMDMRSLFTYIIPYLRKGNDIVKEWDETYGLFLYEGVPTEEGHEDDVDIKSSKELRQKYWHNLNVARLYNIYTPWVDVMYDCSYSKGEKIHYLGEKYFVEDPLNPASYPKERPMIFSRSEMVDFGLTEKDLTRVENKIIECQEGMQERMFKLLNYHNFNDVVLNTASAMNCAFEFNETFSENSVVGANHNIYPQSFELNDFSYDAFLRFILSSSTGESMIVGPEGDFYGNVTANSSMTTVICMLILDIIAMYIIPGLKMFFIVGIFLSAILIILMRATRVDPEQKFVKRLIVSFVKPTLKFMLISCGMAWIVSLFMGEGATGVTGSLQPTISLGDPVMVMVVMIVLNSAVVYLYFKILLDVWKDIKKSAKLVGSFMSGVIGSVAGLATSLVSGKTSGSTSQSSEGSSSIGKDDMGVPNQRASNRGSSVTIINKIKDSNEQEQDRVRRSKEMMNNNSSKKFTNRKERTTDDIEDRISKGRENLKNNKEN